MTDEFRGNHGADGSVLSVDVLADLHAGALSESEAAELWPRVNADPEARAVIEALQAAQADLGSLQYEQVEPMPTHVAERIDAALANEQHTRQQQAALANVVGIDRARSRRKKQTGMAAGFVAVAAAVVAAVAIVVPNLGGGDETPGVAQPAPSEQSSGDGDAGAPSDGSGPLALTKDDGDLAGAIGNITSVRDYGPLETRSRFDACVQAAGADSSKQLAGVRPVTIDGEEAVMALYTTGKTAQFRMVAVSPDCDSAPVIDRVIGR